MPQEENHFEILKQANEIVRTEVFPHLRQVIPSYCSVSVMNYLKGMERTNNDNDIIEKYMFLEPQLCYNFDFLKKYKEQCAGFCSMTQEQRASHGLYRVIYQFERNFHLQLGVYVYFIEGFWHKYLSNPYLLTDDFQKALTFLEENHELTYLGDQNKAKVGFGGLKVI